MSHNHRIIKMEVDANDAESFTAVATEVANEQCYGTLSCVVLADDAAQKTSAFDRLIKDLRFGMININASGSVGYYLPRLSWGAYPGHTPADIGSGVGVVHNTLLLDRVQKSVVRVPFRIPYKPYWQATHGAHPRLARSIVAFFSAPSLLRFAVLAFYALCG